MLAREINILFIAQEREAIIGTVTPFEKAGYQIFYELVHTAGLLIDALNRRSWSLIVLDYEVGFIDIGFVSEVVKSKSSHSVLMALYEELTPGDAFIMGRCGFHYCVCKLQHPCLPSLYEAERERMDRSHDSRNNETMSEPVLKHIADGVISCNRQGDIIFLNDEAKRITGWSSKEAKTKKIAEVFKLVHSKTNIELPDIFEEVINSGQRTGLAKETMLVDRDGRKIFLSANVSPVKDDLDEVMGAVAVFRDISRFKAIEEDLRKEKDSFQTFFQFAPVGMMILDGDREIIDYNQSLAQMIPHPQNRLTGMRIGEGIGCVNSVENGCGNGAGCHVCKIREAIEDVIKTGIPFNNLYMDFDIACENVKQRHYLKASAVPLMLSDMINAIVVMEDITEMRHSELALKENEERFKNLFNNVTDAIFVIHYNDSCNENQQLVEVNDTACKLLGYSREELFELGFKKLFVLDDGDFDIKQLFKAQDTSVQGRLMSSKGSLIDAEIHTHSLVLNGETVIMAIVRDITEQRKAQKEVQRAIEATNAAYKAKSEFLANMSHEIRTPLNGIIGMIDLCLLSSLNEEQMDNMMTAKSCASSLLNIINDILDFSKLEAGKMIIEHIPFNLKELVNKIEKVHYFKANDKGLELSCEADKELPEILYGDPNRLEQVINNLLSNAVKFTEAGWVRLKLELLSITPDSVHVRFNIRDSGIGIAKEDLSKLFQSFTQVDGSHTRKYGGTGLGLVISKHLIDTMGGTLSVSSLKGEGSQFSFELKLDIAKAENALESSERFENLKRAKSKAHILLVEDDRVNQMVVGRMLKMLGYSYETAGNGMEALHLISHKSFRLCLMDIQMPEMDGIQAIAEIRKREEGKDRHLPVIALTAYALSGDKERFLQAGMDDYLSKPIGIYDLGNKLQQVMEKFADPGDSPIRLPQEAYLQVKGQESSQFIHFINKSIRNLGLAIEQGNKASIEKYAHDIQSQASQEGEEFLKMSAFRIVLQARKDNLDELDGYYKKLTDIWHEYVKRC